MRAEKLAKKAHKVFGGNSTGAVIGKRRMTKKALAEELFDLTAFAQARGWSAEQMLSEETKRRERKLRKREARGGSD
jgi:hypothetical protein